jgi:dimethylhistidine N-methyltransferase
VAQDGPPDPLAREVLAGLRSQPKSLPPKLFYDAAGSALFDRITELPEYYLTRAEAEILDRHGPELAALLGDGGVLIEPGCGSSVKAASILRHLARPTYVGLDIEIDALTRGARELRERVPDVTVRSVPVDYTAGFDVPGLPEGRRMAFFPGSTIGNFDRDDAVAFLARLRELVGADGVVVVGADPWKDPAVLRAAYDDAAGVTAEFNRNALRHLVRRYGLVLDPERFAHEIRLDADRRRIEMHLVSIGAQSWTIWGHPVRFEDRETIHTESCHKWTIDEFRALAAEAGLRPVRTFTDREGRFVEHAFAPL